jgi:thiol-disulfide isomerase/thioredoxin
MKTLSKIYLCLALVLCCNAQAQEIPKWKLVDLQAAIEKAEGPTIFNFWATFCKPCMAEIPYFQQMVKKYDSAGVKLVLVNLDLPETLPRLRSLAGKQGITAPIFFLNETDADLFCPAVDEKWSGAIPASLFINNKTGYRKFFEEPLSKEKFEKEIRQMIVDR